MAASDKPYHDQNWLDILFALTSIAMLVSVVMMFMQDYFREFKTEQRVFRDVESKLAQRLALQQMPSLDEFEKAAADVENARDALRQAVAPEKYPQVKADLAQAMTDMETNEATAHFQLSSLAMTASVAAHCMHSAKKTIRPMTTGRV